MNKSDMFSFSRAFAITLLVMFVLLATTIIANRFVLVAGLGSAWKIILAGIVPALIVIAITVVIELKISGQSLSHCLRLSGFGPLHTRQLALGTISLVPIAVAYLIMFKVLHVQASLVVLWPLVFLKFTIAQGVAEEVVFRGFVFRHLRAGRSFGHAATITAVLFSISHLANLFHGFSVEILIGIGISMAFAFLLTYPFAFLFEQGKGVLWGLTVMHVGIDSINVFPKAAEPGLGMMVYLLGIVISCATVLHLGRLNDSRNAA